MKRSLSTGLRADAAPGSALLAREAALALLERSIGFGHGRLAVVRLAMAVQAGAEVPAPHWHYCREAARTDLTLQTLLGQAEVLALQARAAAPLPH